MDALRARREPVTLDLSPAGYRWACERYNMLNENREPDDGAVSKAFGVSKPTIWRVRNGAAAPGPRYIAGALTAWPGMRFEELFVVRPYQPRHARESA